MVTQLVCDIQHFASGGVFNQYPHWARSEGHEEEDYHKISARKKELTSAWIIRSLQLCPDNTRFMYKGNVYKQNKRHNHWSHSSPLLWLTCTWSISARWKGILLALSSKVQLNQQLLRTVRFRGEKGVERTDWFAAFCTIKGYKSTNQHFELTALTTAAISPYIWYPYCTSTTRIVVKTLL